MRRISPCESSSKSFDKQYSKGQRAEYDQRDSDLTEVTSTDNKEETNELIELFLDSQLNKANMPEHD